MPLKALKFIRKMRGGAQAHLLEASDGNFYVVKFRNNPQHRRILVNEWVASAILRHLQVSAPPTAIIELTPEFLDGNPEVSMRLGSRTVPPEAGWHFGSRYPSDPARLAVYDFLPDALLDRVVNLREFLGALVADKWMGNADSRQAVFFRARIQGPTQVKGERAGFVAWMMDHGYVFDGPHWAFHDSPLFALYFRTSVYAGVRSLDDFQPWLDRVVHFPEQVLDDCLKQIPSAWLEEDYESMVNLLEALLVRRKKVPELLAATRDTRTAPFPRWSESK